MVISAASDLCDAFNRTLKGIGLFEKSPHVAVALSGGGDSVALLHLVCDWARSTGATISALTVDHGLRRNARVEAELVGKRARELGIAHHILPWISPKPLTGIQSAARQARYKLMEDWCKTNNVLHLMVGHTRDDQVETYLMRKSHGSGPHGMAGMSQLVELPACRIIRPLLNETRERLRGYLDELGVEWVEDPSNQDEKFERIKWRNQLSQGNYPTLEAHEAIREYGAKRLSDNQALADCMARMVNLHSFGYATVAWDRFVEIPKALAEPFLARLLLTIGGRSYGPSPNKVKQLVSRLYGSGPVSETLSGCLLKRDLRHLYVIREHRNSPDPLRVRPSEQIWWDNRFKIILGKTFEGAKGPLILRPFEEADWPLVKRHLGKEWIGSYRLSICRSLPTISDDMGLLAVPHLGYQRSDQDDCGDNADEIVQFLSFCPLISLSGSGFTVA